MRDSLSWNRALTLSERDFLYPKGSAPPGFDTDLTRQRLDAWKQEADLHDKAYFQLRLEQQALDEARFSQLLGSPAPPFKETPPWLAQLEKAYHRAPRYDLDTFWLEPVQDQDDRVFLGVVRPLLDHALHQLETRLTEPGRKISEGIQPQRFVQLWALQLPAQFLQMISRTLMLELFLSRLQDQLEGSTPEQRFESFLARLCTPEGTLKFLADYPVLGRLLASRVRQWLAAGLELAERLDCDLPALANYFGKSDLGELTGLKTGMSDRHQDGRTVAVLEFSSTLKLVYKPRSLALDVQFQELLEWLGKVGIEPRLRTLKILDRGTYGWCEFVEAAPCHDLDQVQRFYARQGVYLALLFALEATDFHHENLIAAGEHPVLIDLETIFQPILADAKSERERLNPAFTTVLRSGLLPRQTGGGGGIGEVDLSGLGATRNQLQPVRVLTDVGTDQMSYQEAQSEFPVGNHLPTLNGEDIRLSSMTTILRRSFETTYRKLIQLRPEFLRSGGWLDRFAGVETRVIVRPTQVYLNLIYQSYHPDYLQDALHRERLFDKLWLDADALSWIPQIIPGERQKLLRDDVPHFSTRTDSRDLFAGELVLPNALAESGLELTRRRFASLDASDLERQLAIFDLALTSHRRLDDSLEDDPRALRPLPEGSAARKAGEFLNASRDIGKRLGILSMGAKRWVSWFDLAPNPDGTQALQPVGFDLYSGLSGIALFYAQLGRLTGEDRWTQIARRALQAARQRFEDRNLPARSYLGGYSGIGGWIYALTYLGAFWEDPAFLDAAEQAREMVIPAVANDEGLDLITGSAGCIAGLLALHQHRPHADTLAAATACGDHLLALATPQDCGIAWQIQHVAERPLTGFAHGTAGIAWALARLARATGEARFERGARDALAYERNLFSPTHANWPDLRTDRMEDGEWGFFHAWCHGAPGIGLSRLSLLGLLDDSELEGEARSALRSTRALGFGGSHCLCHGDLGNLELLTYAGSQLKDLQLLQSAQQLAGQILAGWRRDGSRCGLSSQVELPGLMTGLAGIGYGFLRIADPDTVPSVLLLETP